MTDEDELHLTGSLAGETRVALVDGALVVSHRAGSLEPWRTLPAPVRVSIAPEGYRDVARITAADGSLEVPLTSFERESLDALLARVPAPAPVVAEEALPARAKPKPTTAVEPEPDELEDREPDAADAPAALDELGRARRELLGVLRGGALRATRRRFLRVLRDRKDERTEELLERSKLIDRTPKKPARPPKQEPRQPGGGKAARAGRRPKKPREQPAREESLTTKISVILAISFVLFVFAAGVYSSC